MMKKDGSLFHIDFGHFLGHFKKKLGFDREKGPFNFTPQYRAAMGGASSEHYRLFIDTLADFYVVVRAHAGLFVTLLALSFPSGLPELQTPEDIAWLRNKCRLELSPHQAGDHMRAQVKEALGQSKRQAVMDG